MACFYAKELIVTTKEGVAKQITAPCGKCLGCYIDKVSEWALRARLELRNHKEACFVTLTYDEENLPPGAELRRKDIQDFLKRLRRSLEPLKIRYYGCAEYGEKGNRPHFHLIIFGWKPSDMVYFFTNEDGDPVYLSAFLEKKWNNGFISVANVNDRTIRYCSMYLQKVRQNVDKKVKPFMIYSSRPALGYDGLTDKEIVEDAVYVSGKKRKLPRSYLRRFENNEWSDHLPVIKEKREEKSKFFDAEIKDPMFDSEAKLKFLKERLDFYSNL